MDLELQIQRMTLEEKVGQMFVVCATGLTMSESFASMLRQYRFGAVYLYDRNYINPHQFRHFCTDLSAAIQDACRGVPAILAASFEGGNQTRFGLYNTSIPYAWALGERGDGELIRRAGQILGAQLSGFGINLNLAPFLNLRRRGGIFKLRSFGADGAETGRRGGWLIQGMHEAGVGCAAKHFPGLGAFDCVQDGNCLVGSAGRRLLFDEHLRPFAAAIQNGVDAVMLGHLLAQRSQYSDPGEGQNYFLPLCDCLREEFSYDGVIATDEMQTLTQVSLPPPERIAQNALRADVDLLIFGVETKKQLLVYETILESVARGKISEERIDRSVRRILQLKKRLEAYGEKRHPMSLQAQAGIMSALSRSTVRVVTAGRALPLASYRGLNILAVMPRNSNLTNVGYSRTMNCCLADVAGERAGRLEALYFEHENSACFSSLPEESFDLVLLAAENPSPHSDLVGWLNRMSQVCPAVYLAIADLDAAERLCERVAVVSLCSNSNESMIRAVALILPPDKAAPYESSHPMT